MRKGAIHSAPTLIWIKPGAGDFADGSRMKSRPPLRHCPICGIAMQAKKSSEHLTRFDTFECMTCATTIVEQPARKPAHSSGNGNKN